MPVVATKTEEPYPQTWRSATFDDAAIQVLEVRLRGADRDLRGQTAYRLREEGAAAVPALCEALKDPDLDIRAAAAESLAEIGDARALKPLSEALKACFDTGSARKQRVIGIVIAIGIAILVIALFLGMVKLRMAAFMGGTWGMIGKGLGSYFRKQRARGPQIQALTAAIDRIASREPTPELRTLLPELEAVAADPLLHTASTRAATREVAGRIAALTERIKSMPVAAEAPRVEPEQLPVVSQPR